MEAPKVATPEAAWLMHEGSLAFSEMMRHGIRIDVGYLRQHTLETEKEIADIKRRLYADKMWARWEKKHGNRATLGNKTQLGGIVFDDMKYQRRHSLIKKDKANENFDRFKAKNDEAAFGGCDLPFVKDYFRWQKLEKLYNTYLKGIAREVVDGRIHPFFHLHKVRTYRSSSSEINFTNIPNRNAEIARRIRRCFVPDEGCYMVEGDYSGVEVRSACCYTKDEQLIKEFTGPGGDPHGDTAMQLFNITREMMAGWGDDAKKAWKKGMRDWSKNRFVFPQFFGSVYFQCAPHIWEAVESGAMMPDGSMTVKAFLEKQGIDELGDCSEGGSPDPGTFAYQVKKVEESFWNKRFVQYTAWKKRWWNNYLMKGYFQSLSGFVFHGIYGRNDCLNYGIQCFAFHWLLLAVIKLQKRMKREKMKTKLVGTIHDCFVGNSPKNEVQDFFHMAREVMTEDVPKHWPSIIVGLEVEMEIVPDGLSWADKVVAKEKGGRWRWAA